MMASSSQHQAAGGGGGAAGDSHVQFDPSLGTTPLDDGEERGRERYLTAKYGAHQMQLIRKRIATEQWLIDELQRISKTSNQVEIDLDEVLDIEKESDRHTFLQDKLQHLNVTSDVSDKFMCDLLERVKKL